jgi:hypothetical protein
MMTEVVYEESGGESQRPASRDHGGFSARSARARARVIARRMLFDASLCCMVMPVATSHKHHMWGRSS